MSRRRFYRRRDLGFDGAFQTRPSCWAYTGGRPPAEFVTRSLFGFPRRAICPGCRLDVDLDRGRIPRHRPGPPPFDRCPSCARRHVPSYNDPLCDRCAAPTEAIPA